MLQCWARRAAWPILCLVALLVLFLPADLLAAQQEPPPTQPPGTNLTFRSLTRALGLVHPIVRSILQDQRGFMWFGTNAGLNRYDGYRFTGFTSNQGDSSGPGTMIISALAEDHDGLVWVGTIGAGLFTYDPRTGRFRRVLFDRQAGASHVEIRSLLVDRGGALWIGNVGAGLSRRDPATGQFTHYRHNPADRYAGRHTRADRDSGCAS